MPTAAIDTSRYVLDIHRDLSIRPRTRSVGRPERIDGMTVGVMTLSPDAPARHRGEMHPDGDELLCVVSGRVHVHSESQPDAPVELGPGQACVVRKGEWHRIVALEAGQLIHITPGPAGDYRPI